MIETHGIQPAADRLTEFDFKAIPVPVEIHFPLCGAAGCRWGTRTQGAFFFVHANAERFSMLQLSEESLRDIDVDLWGEHISPWIERLHKESGA